VLDETRVVDKSKERSREAALLYLIMRLALGQEKGRRTDFGAPLHFRSTLLSLSNMSLDDMGLAAREEIDDAYRGRLIDVPLPANCVGAFENLHGLGSHAALSAELQRIARSHHGVAARDFLKRFARELRDDKASIAGWLEERRQGYLKRVRPIVVSPNRDLERVHQKFATIYAAGALAIDYEILPWSRGELLKALFECERVHVDHVAPFLPQASSPRQARPLNPLERLRQHVTQNRSKFVDLRRGPIERSTGHKHDSCPGYVNQRRDGTVEILFPSPVLSQLCGGFSGVKRLKNELDRNGHLISDSERGVTRRFIWRTGDRVSVTAVRETAFEDS
jgi:putative DNA primase/helicase